MAVTTMVEGARVINELADMIDSMSEKQQIKYIDIGNYWNIIMAYFYYYYYYNRWIRMHAAYFLF